MGPILVLEVYPPALPYVAGTASVEGVEPLSSASHYTAHIYIDDLTLVFGARFYRAVGGLVFQR